MSPAANARAAASVSRALAIAGALANITVASSAGLATKRCSRPSASNAVAANGAARKRSSAAAIWAIESPRNRAHAGERRQTMLNLSRIAGA